MPHRVGAEPGGYLSLSLGFRPELGEQEGVKHRGSESPRLRLEREASV